MEILSLFSERLQEIIFDNKTSPEKISADLKHNVYDIYHWMSQNNKYMPSVNSIIKFADYFNCSIDYFIGLTDESAKKGIKKILPDFSERFVFVVRKSGLNLYRLGKITNTSTTTYYRWINGVSVPTIDSLIKVATALDCSLDYLVGREE